MSDSSAPNPRRPLTRATARNAALINQLATPGLGSLLGRRYLAGSGQLLLALTGFGMLMAWFILLIVRLYQQMNASPAPEPPSIAWLGEGGAAAFAGAWLWALFTSLSLLREAREQETAAK